MTDQNPSEGGSYLRDPVTGALTPNKPVEPGTPPDEAKPDPKAAKPAKTKASED